ncbi:IclR family transcriptional regulator [Sporosarcina sp. CAU 1771]
MTEEKFSKNYSLQTVHRAIQILKVFSREHTYLSLTELHKLTGLSVSTLQRLTSTLVYEGFLHRNEQTKKYQLGLGLLFLGELVEKSSGIVSIAQPVLERINRATTESVSLNIIENNERRCIYNLGSQHKLSANTYVGDTSPLYAGATAKVLLANLSTAEIHMYLDEVEFEQITEKTITSKGELLTDLREIKEQGYAISYGERVKGAVSVSAPVINEYDEVLASITVIIPSVRFEEHALDELIQVVVSGATEIKAQLKG